MRLHHLAVKASRRDNWFQTKCGSLIALSFHNFINAFDVVNDVHDVILHRNDGNSITVYEGHAKNRLLPFSLIIWLYYFTHSIFIYF